MSILQYAFMGLDLVMSWGLVEEKPDTVIKRLLPTLKRLAKRVSASFPAFSVDDLRQVGAEGAFKAMAQGQYDASKGAKLDTWLYSKARFEMLKHIRDAATAHRYESEAARAVANADDRLPNDQALVDELFALPASYAVNACERRTPEDALAAREAVDLVEEFFAELSERDKAFVRLRYVEDLTLEEIGVALGYTRSALSRVEKRTREGLHRHMARSR